MRHGYTILNQSVNFLTEYGLRKMPQAQAFAKRQRTVKKVLYAIFFDNKGQVSQTQIPSVEKRICQEILLGLQCITSSWVRLIRTMKGGFKNWIDRLKRCKRADGEYFEGQKTVK